MAVNLPYPNMDYVPLDILTAAEMNQMVANDQYLANMWGLADTNGIILPRHFNQQTFASTNNSMKLGNVLIQWGVVSSPTVGTNAPSEASDTITFPIAFSAAPVVTVSMGDLNGVCAEFVTMNGASTTAANFTVGHSLSGGGNATSVQWIAIGIKN